MSNEVLEMSKLAAVLTDRVQDFTDAEKAQARANIGIPDIVPGSFDGINIVEVDVTSSEEMLRMFHEWKPMLAIHSNNLLRAVGWGYDAATGSVEIHFQSGYWRITDKVSQFEFKDAGYYLFQVSWGSETGWRHGFVYDALSQKQHKLTTGRGITINSSTSEISTTVGEVHQNYSGAEFFVDGTRRVTDVVDTRLYNNYDRVHDVTIVASSSISSLTDIHLKCKVITELYDNADPEATLQSQIIDVQYIDYEHVNLHDEGFSVRTTYRGTYATFKFKSCRVIFDFSNCEDFGNDGQALRWDTHRYVRF